MAFKLTELVIESVLRDGMKLVKDSIGTSTDIIDDVFGEMLEDHLARYFGRSEINKIKDLVKNDNIYISQGYSLEDVKAPIIGINLASNTETESQASFEDYVDEIDAEIEPTVIVEEFTATSYDSVTGLIDVNAADPDLSSVRVGQVFIDGDGNDYPIVGGIDNDDGAKHFFVDAGETITNLTDCTIKSSVDISRRVQRGVRDQELITLTILSTNQLLTKYVYVLAKYILLANKTMLIGRGLELSSYNGSDFTRTDHLPNNVFARFLTVKCDFVEHTWLGESRTVFEAADPAIKVPRDLYRREDEDDLTVETVEEDDDE